MAGSVKVTGVSNVEPGLRNTGLSQPLLSGGVTRAQRGLGLLSSLSQLGAPAPWGLLFSDVAPTPCLSACLHLVEGLRVPLRLEKFRVYAASAPSLGSRQPGRKERHFWKQGCLPWRLGGLGHLFRPIAGRKKHKSPITGSQNTERRAKTSSTSH